LVWSRFRSAQRRSADASLGTEGASYLTKVWLDSFGGTVLPTTTRYANVDAIWIKNEQIAFLEFLTRRIEKDKYETLIFDTPQLNKIEELFKITGWKTFLVVCYTDHVGYAPLPDRDIIVPSKLPNTEGLRLDDFYWLDVQRAGRPAPALP
jgi:hypothetical protein